MLGWGESIPGIITTTTAAGSTIITTGSIVITTGSIVIATTTTTTNVHVVCASSFIEINIPCYINVLILVTASHTGNNCSALALGESGIYTTTIPLLILLRGGVNMCVRTTRTKYEHAKRQTQLATLPSNLQPHQHQHQHQRHTHTYMMMTTTMNINHATTSSTSVVGNGGV